MSGDLSYEAIEIGKRVGPFYYPLQDRIARYLEATGNKHPWHRERSPWGPPVAPPTVIGNATLRFIDTVAPVPPGTLHAKQEIETLAALRLDRRPMAYGQFVDKYERRGRRWFVFEARWRDETGLILGHTRTTMAFPDRVETDGDPPSVTKEQKTTAKEGELTPITRTVTLEGSIAFSEDSANHIRGSSVHTDPDVARKAGFENAIAQGMIAADHISELMTNVFGRAWFANATLSLAFLKPILVGTTLTADGRLASAEEEGAVVRKTYEVWSKDDGGDIVAAGTASSLVSPV